MANPVDFYYGGEAFGKASRLLWQGCSTTPVFIQAADIADAHRQTIGLKYLPSKTIQHDSVLKYPAPPPPARVANVDYNLFVQSVTLVATPLTSTSITSRMIHGVDNPF